MFLSLSVIALVRNPSGFFRKIPDERERHRCSHTYNHLCNFTFIYAFFRISLADPEWLLRGDDLLMFPDVPLKSSAAL
jgi:hypothetical protein